MWECNFFGFASSRKSLLSLYKKRADGAFWSPCKYTVIVPGDAGAQFQLGMLNQSKEIPQTFNQLLLWAQMNCRGCSKRGAALGRRRMAQQDPEKGHTLSCLHESM